jgi:AraC-like DNA-binding protein
MHMNSLPTVDLHLRSYGQVRATDRHDYAQLVLPLSGALLLEIEGMQGRLDPLHAGFIAPGAWHSQCGDAPNQSIILDLGLDSVAPEIGERLFERRFAPLSPASRKLVEFMGIIAQTDVVPSGVLRGWVPLLLDTLALDGSQPTSRATSRLAALLARVEADPGLPWTTDAMARSAGLSVSRLHALFREELAASPHEWLLGVRIARVCDWLAGTEIPIAELALRAGFSEQSALTRAMRKAIGMTPAAYRRETRSRRQ